MESLILKKNGSYDKCILNKDIDLDNLKQEDFIKNTKKMKNLEKLGNWDINKNKLIFYGYSDGKAGDENKHELPPPYENNLYFKDIVVIKCVKDKLTELYEKDWLNYYEELYGGFDDVDTEEESYDDIDDTDDSFIVKTEEDISIGIGELPTDEDEAEFTFSGSDEDFSLDSD